MAPQNRPRSVRRTITWWKGDEDVRLDLAYNSGAATLGAQDSHTVTIQDADLASVEFALAASSAGENAGGHNVVVNLNIAAGVTLQDAATFSISAVDIDTTGTDYNLNTTSVTFASGSGNGATETATITPVDDNLVEGDEDVRLDLALQQWCSYFGRSGQSHRHHSGCRRSECRVRSGQQQCGVKTRLARLSRSI